MLPKQDMPISVEQPPALGHHCVCAFFLSFQTSANSYLRRMKNASSVTGFARLYTFGVLFFLSSVPETAQMCHESTVKAVFLLCLVKTVFHNVVSKEYSHG